MAAAFLADCPVPRAYRMNGVAFRSVCCTSFLTSGFRFQVSGPPQRPSFWVHLTYKISSCLILVFCQLILTATLKISLAMVVHDFTRKIGYYLLKSACTLVWSHCVLELMSQLEIYWYTRTPVLPQDIFRAQNAQGGKKVCCAEVQAATKSQTLSLSPRASQIFTKLCVHTFLYDLLMYSTYRLLHMGWGSSGAKAHASTRRAKSRRGDSGGEWQANFRGAMASWGKE